MSRIQHVTALLLLALLVPLSVHAGRITLRPAAVDPNALPAEWRTAFTMLAAVVEDDDFQDSLREYLRSSTAPRLDYCRITSVICDANYQVVALNLTDVRGSVAWQSIPKGMKSISVHNSVLRESFDLTNLPYWVKKLSMHNVVFNADGPAKFRKRQSMLQYFRCTKCHIKALVWSTVPSLTHLDLSDNPLGSFDFASLPPTLQYFNMSNCNASLSSLSLQSLPPPLTSLDVSGNRMTGPISSVVFPSSLEVLRMSKNRLDGEIQLDNLPFTLLELDVSHNEFRGKIGDMSMFMSLTTFQLSNNRITGIDFAKLPTQLEELDISKNLIAESIDVAVLPSTMISLNISHNKFTGLLRIASLPPALATLDVSYNKLSGQVDLTKFSESMRIVYVQHNSFEGNPDLTNLPVNLRRILIHDNQWESLMPPLYL